MKATLLTTQSGDWEGVFLGNDLFEEGHKIGDGDSVKWWLEFGKMYDIGPGDLTTHEINDDDERRLSSTGGFPDKLSDLSGEYA